ncbi:MAG: hypothetical protein ACLU8W_10630 [Clostridia bacterium]
MKKSWWIRGMAMGAVLAFTLASGVGVQAKSPEELAKVTQISQAEFEALKPAGEATLEQKREVIGDILMDAGVPEFMVEKLDGDMLESLYESPGVEVKVNNFRETSNGELEQISGEQRRRISQYNRTIKYDMEHPLSGIMLSNGDDGVLIDSVQEIPNLVHVLIVGGKFPNGERLLSTVGAWETAPASRLKDFIGVCSNGMTTNDPTAKASLEYTITDYGANNGAGSSEERSIDYVPSTSKFVEGTQGTGIEIDLPNNYTLPDAVTGVGRRYSMSNIVLGINVMAKTEESIYKVVGEYHHNKWSLLTSVGISSSGLSFSVSPQLAYDDSTVSIPIGFD